jgi:cobalamin biosynthesis protein CobT
MLPKRRDWSVLIGIDASGSAMGREIEVEKKVAAGQAALLHALGIPFSIYAHSGVHSGSGSYALMVEEIATPTTQFTKAMEKLSTLNAYSANLDGHTMQVYRKLLQKQRGKDKLLLYFTDGAMPAENYSEELPLLQKEILLMRRLGIHLLGIGIGCDDPKRHGLDTIVVNSTRDLPDMLEGLRQRLIR